MAKVKEPAWKKDKTEKCTYKIILPDKRIINLHHGYSRGNMHVEMDLIYPNGEPSYIVGYDTKTDEIQVFEGSERGGKRKFLTTAPKYVDEAPGLSQLARWRAKSLLEELSSK